jgi:prolyl-tRNA synthetase
VLAHWDGTAETEERIQEETKATIRCIPLDAPEEEGAVFIQGNLLSAEFYLRRRIK